MDEEVIDVKLTEKDEEEAKKSLGVEEFLEKNKLTVGLLLVGILLVGLGFLGFKTYDLFSNQPKVEILGESAVEGGKLEAGSETMEVGKITVEIAGEVEKPGVYELKIGSRVNDLLIAAGGIGANADREWVAKSINLAQKLIDGAKIYIPNKLKVQSEKLKVTGEGTININTASVSELDSLWGVGEVTTKKIIENRPYKRTEELLEKKIVKSNVWEVIKDKITVY